MMIYKATQIPTNAIVKLPDGRIGRLEKESLPTTKKFWVIIPTATEGKRGVEIDRFQELDILEYPGIVIDDVIAHKYYSLEFPPKFKGNP